MLETTAKLRLDSARFVYSAGIAQSVEQLIRNEKVVGSIPISGTRKRSNFNGI
jgi:hypothetical protein